MSSTQKRAFRLPWGGDRPDDADGVDPILDALKEEARRNLAEEPVARADDAESTTTDAVPAATQEPDTTPEDAMLNADVPVPDTAAEPPPASAETGEAWPSVDRRGTDRRSSDRRVGERRGPERPFALNATGAGSQPRRGNPLVAGLVKAMREAAVASRAETTARLEAEATARVEAIRARATTESAELRKRADDDVTAIREWSKEELARVRQETDNRIEARKAELAAETNRHGASVDQLVDEVKGTVASFEADMDEFFTRLLAENDPAQLAALAEQAPDPPDLTGEGPAATDLLASRDAAEAEAAAAEGLDPRDIASWPPAAPTGAGRSDPVATAGEPNGPDSTRLLVTGLTSVAGISAFKGALGQVPGVRSVSVSSGDPGVFVFAVNHDPGVDLDSGVASLPTFGAQITDATDDGFTVVAHEPAA